MAIQLRDAMAPGARGCVAVCRACRVGCGWVWCIEFEFGAWFSEWEGCPLVDDPLPIPTPILTLVPLIPLTPPAPFVPLAPSIEVEVKLGVEVEEDVDAEPDV